MEHEIEKKIREKILQAEEHPVRWNRDDVWNKLNPGKENKKRPVAFYYAAASVCLLAVAIIFTIQRREDNKTALAIKTLEQSIESLRLSEARAQTESSIEETECPEDTGHITSVAPKPLVRQRDQQRTKKESTVTSEKQQEQSLAVVETKDENKTITESTIETPNQTVLPQTKSIVTTIIVAAPDEVPAQTAKVVRKKKLRFNLFKPDKGGVESDHKTQDDSEILVARIN